MKNASKRASKQLRASGSTQAHSENPAQIPFQILFILAKLFGLQACCLLFRQPLNTHYGTEQLYNVKMWTCILSGVTAKRMDCMWHKRQQQRHIYRSKGLQSSGTVRNTRCFLFGSLHFKSALITHQSMFSSRTRIRKESERGLSIKAAAQQQPSSWWNRCNHHDNFVEEE